MASSEYQVKYNGSIPWLIFWAVVFFPVAIMLFFTGAYFRSNETYYSLAYKGSRLWLAFWIVIFFPVALLLLIANGCSWNVVDNSDPNTIVIR